jgi:signal transduction histidine kinase
MRLKIRTKLVLTFLGALVIAAVALGGAILAILLLISGANGKTNAFAVGKLASDRSALVADALAHGADPATLRRAAVPPDLPEGLRIRVIDSQGRVWVDTEGNEGRTASGAELMGWLDQISEPAGGMVTLPERITVGGKPWGFYGVTFASHYGLNLNLNQDSPQNRLAVIVFLGGLGLALVVNIALFWAFGWHIAKPLRRLSGVVSRIAAGDLSARVGLTKRGDELGQLAQDLDLMASRLEEARDQAAAAEKARRYMVAAASHDLRTPLTALLAHAEAVRTGVSEDPQASLAVIERKGLQLKQLIDDLFELAALDATAERWQTVRQDLAELVRQSVVGILPELEAKGIEVEAAIPEEPVWANLAPGKLERVIDNLLANGLKYGASGGYLGVRVERRGERIRVEVANRGPAIPPEVAAQIFERFYRADSARTSSVGGSGLGLAIAREIVVRHGGAIGVESPAAGGAVFWFELPGV